MDATLREGDALVIVDVQVDFVSGSLAVPGARAILPALNRYLRAFRAAGLPVAATRDWHPPAHASFASHGGPWPPHCVAGTEGARFDPGLELDERVHVVSKGTHAEREAYSGFDGTDLDAWLGERGVRRLFVGGLATEYCVRATVRDALARGYAVRVLADAVRAVDLRPGDGEAALRNLASLGAACVTLDALEPAGHG
jgi:nicotinamidase/pyrazinamidase